MYNENIRVSFDFDGTLFNVKEVQAYCKYLINKGIDVHITTRRYGDAENANPDDPWWQTKGDRNWKEVYELAKSFGIKKENVHFCNMKMKYHYFKDNDFLWHLDDDIVDVEDINEGTKTKGVYINHDWLNICEILIKEKNGNNKKF